MTPHRRQGRWRTAVLRCMLPALLVLPCRSLTAQEPAAPAVSPFLTLDSGWEYRRGDAPLDSPGRPLLPDWNRCDTCWQRIASPAALDRLPACTDVWFRTTLPAWKGSQPSLYIAYVINIMEVYLADSLLYSTGDFRSGVPEPVMGWTWYLVNLPADFAGKQLTLRVRSSSGYAGIKGGLQIGRDNDFVNRIVDDNMGKTILGFIFIIAGIICLLLFVPIKGLRVYIGFVVAQIAMGVWTLSESGLTQFFFPYPALQYYLYHISLYVSIIGFTFFTEHLVAARFKPAYTLLRRLQIGYAVVMSAIDIVFRPDHQALMTPFFIFLSISIAIILWCSLRSFRTASQEHRMLLITLGGYGLFGLAEMFLYFSHILFNQWTAIDARFMHYGGFFFFSLLTWIVVSGYVRMTRQVILTQELERRRIARDLHDEVGPRLTEIKLVSEIIRQAPAAETEARLAELSAAADNVASTFGEIVWALNPRTATLDDLCGYLGQYAIDFLHKADIRCRLDLPAEFPPLTISYEMRRNIMLAAKEALNNIVKHADASVVSVAASLDDETFRVTIADDGQGFDRHSVRAYGNGLNNIRRRIETVGGSVVIDSSAGAGTTIRMSIPAALMSAQ